MRHQNPQYDFNNRMYLQKVTHPIFTRSASLKEFDIIERSASVPFETSLQLQNKWISYHNNTATVERLRTQTALKYFLFSITTSKPSKLIID